MGISGYIFAWLTVLISYMMQAESIYCRADVFVTLVKVDIFISTHIIASVYN